MRVFYIIISIITIIGCQYKSSDDSKINKNNIDTTFRIETKIFGDSLKIVYKYHGDTVIQNRIDLKGTSGDGFDDSFTVKSVWSTKYTTDLNCSQKLTLSLDGYNFLYCLKKAIQKVESDIENSGDKPWVLEGFQELKNELIKIESGETDTFSIPPHYFIFDLLRNIDFSIYNAETKYKIEKVIIEQYVTNFSGGRYYYLIGNMKDTVAQFHLNEWME